MKLPIYLDNQATTRIDPEVLSAMMPVLTEDYGNAASRNHPFGWKAEEYVEKAREEVANIIGATSKEIIFTSGATEANNLAIKGLAYMYQERGKHIITLKTEHKAVLDTCKHLEREGFLVTYLSVQKNGLLDLEMLKSAIRPDTILISVMAANNEIGVIQPLAEIGHISKEHKIIFHCDAAQAIGKIPIDVEKLKIDLMSISGHKIYGPKGIGALYIRRSHPRVRLEPVIHGGGHERGLRSGTLNIPGIVGLGKACEIARVTLSDSMEKMSALKKRLVDGILSQLTYVTLNGDQVHCLPGCVNVSFAYVEGESLLMGLNEEVALSSGSACTSASLEPSHVLKALGVDEDLVHTSLRFGVGRFNTIEEIDYVIRRVVETVKRLRDLSPLYEMAIQGVDIHKVNWNIH